MARKLNLDTKLDSEFSKALQAQLGDTIRKPVRMFLGNPNEDDQLNFSATKFWICDDPNEPNVLTAIPKSGIPDAKRTIGTAILCKRTRNGYRFMDVDWDYDEQFSEDENQQTNQKPVLVSQLSYGTIQPYSGMSVMIKGAFYGGIWKPDFITGDIDNQVDTSAANINKPTTNNRAIGVLVQFNAGTLEFTYKQSAQYPANISLEQQYIKGNLPLPDDNCHRVGYIQLYNAQTSIIHGDIFQAPDWISAIPLRASGSVTDEAIVRWDGATGRLLQDSFVSIDDDGNVLGVETLNFNSSVLLTIASGAVTATSAYHRIDTQAAAGTDDLDTINWASGSTTSIFIRAEDAARTVVVKHGTGNIETPTGTDISLDETYKVLLLLYDNNASVWKVVGGAGSGGSFTSFSVAGDSGTPQTITDGNTLTLTGAAGIDTVASATDVVSIAVDSTVIRTTGTQSIGAGLTITTPTIADFTNATHDHTNAAGGGQITDAALSAAVGIAKGGTGQTTQTAGFNALSPLTTKGDIVTRDATNNVRLPVGADGKVLVADSSLTNGVGYKGSLVEIVAPTQLGSDQTTITFSSIPAYYQDLVVVIKARSSSSGSTVSMTLNADTGSNYAINRTQVDQAGTETHSNTHNGTALNFLNASAISTDTSGYFGHLEATIFSYLESAISRTGHYHGTRFSNATTLIRVEGSFAWENLANAISSIELNLSAGDFLTGTVYALYGRGIAS